MYLNYKLGINRGHSFEELNVIQLIHQHKTDNSLHVIKLIPNNIILELFNKGLLCKIKKKNKDQDELDLIRLSKKGNRLLKDLQTYKSVEEDFILYDYVLKAFKVLEKGVESRNKIVKLIAFFRLETGLTHREIYYLIKAFISDKDNMKYNHKMSYIFFKGETVFQKPTLDNSRLYSYYLKTKKQ